MSLILASTRAISLLAGIGYDVVFQTMVRTGSSIVNTAYYLTERPDYPKALTSKVYQLDLAAKIALINSYLSNVKCEIREARSNPFRSWNNQRPKISEIPRNDPCEQDESTPEQVFETVDYLDALISGDASLLNKMVTGLETELNDFAKSFSKGDQTIIHLLYLQQSLVRIDNILLYIKRKFAEHQQKWFNSWRKLDLKKDLHQLELETKILEDRVLLISQLGGAIRP